MYEDALASAECTLRMNTKNMEAMLMKAKSLAFLFRFDEANEILESLKRDEIKDSSVEEKKKLDAQLYIREEIERVRLLEA